MLDIGYAVHKSLPAALWAAVKRTVRTWRYARSIGVDPTHWWGVYEGGTEICLASVGPLPGAEQRARTIAEAIEADAPLSLRKAAEAERDRFKDALLNISNGDVPRNRAKPWAKDGSPSKHDRCEHGRWFYEDCDTCTSNYAESVLAQGIEAQRAETVGQGSVHVSPVAESDAPKTSPAPKPGDVR